MILNNSRQAGYCVALHLILVGVAVIVTGCSTLQPVELQDEHSLAPVQSALWSQLSAVRSDDWLYLLNTGDEAIEWRLRVINSASGSLDLQTFLWKEDGAGLSILRHLFEAADRGVRVRILLDDTFFGTHDKAIWKLDQHPNIEFRVYNPYARRNSNILVRQLLNLGDFSRVDHRMHNKLMVVDNRAAIVGGRNLADEYFGSHGEVNFRDLEVLTAGSTVRSLSQEFDDYWNSNWSFPADRLITVEPARGLDEFETWIENIVAPGLEENKGAQAEAWKQVAQAGVSAELQVFADNPAAKNPAAQDEMPNQLAKAIISWIESAKQDLTLVSAYLIPTPEFEQAVERAEKRGVRVRILTNSLRSNNHVAAHSAYRHHVRRLVDHGADVHEVHVFAKDRELYMDGPVDDKHLGLHGKLLLIDDHLSYIGSANFDPRSLRINTEMGLLIKSSEFNGLLREVLAIDFHRRNAWHLRVQKDGKLTWVSDDAVLNHQPAESFIQRIEDWFLGVLPIDDEM